MGMHSVEMDSSTWKVSTKEGGWKRSLRDSDDPASDTGNGFWGT